MRRSITISNSWRMTVLVAVLLIAAPAAASAQSATAVTKSRRWADPQVATLMLVDDLGRADARAVVIRRPGDMPNNIILVTRATTAADLATAATALIQSRHSRGDVVEREIRALIGAAPKGTRPGDAKPRGDNPSPVPRHSSSPSEGLAARDLQRLRRAPAFSIAGIGRGPALVIRMSDGKKAKTN